MRTETGLMTVLQLGAIALVMNPRLARPADFIRGSPPERMPVVGCPKPDAPPALGVPSMRFVNFVPPISVWIKRLGKRFGRQVRVVAGLPHAMRWWSYQLISTTWLTDAVRPIESVTVNVTVI
jgi:hypothetical protein